MRTLFSRSLLGTAILVAPLLAISLSGCATRAGSESDALASTASPQGVELLRLAEADQPTRTASPGGAQEGIKVHGHWTIEVRDPDDIVVTHREFENSLQVGARTLGPVLGRASTVGLWQVGVGDANGLGPCLGPFPNPPNGVCELVESATSPLQGPWQFPTLTVSAPLFPSPNAGTLTLSGTFTVQFADPIAVVGAFVGGCAPTVAPTSCTSNFFNEGPGYSFFSGTLLSTPINVTVGQLIQVTVVFSFS